MRAIYTTRVGGSGNMADKIKFIALDMDGILFDPEYKPYLPAVHVIGEIMKKADVKIGFIGADRADEFARDGIVIGERLHPCVRLANNSRIFIWSRVSFD